ncbi:MAG: GTP cyclohydrolase II [Myxococcales bacterium]|nr:GTP cyclohydrolase II [Myxococcales bacterium]
MHVPERVIRPHTEWVASAEIPTRFGTFSTQVFESVDADGARKEHVALVYGDVSGGVALPVRVHSECMTSEVFGSLKCDCREQLEAAMKLIAKRGAGVIVYLRQEGRGIGLANKIRAYDLQSRGHDTVDANRLLGLPDDAREYHAAADMLAHLGVKSIVLLTNNPAKVSAMRELGVTVTGREPVLVPATPYSAGYLDAKRERMQHLLPARAAHAGEPFLRAVGGPPGDAE